MQYKYKYKYKYKVMEEKQEMQIIDSPDMIAGLTKAEIDVQISTAKRFPRDIAKSLRNIKSLATVDQETMESMFYHLERKDANGETTDIDGLSVRMAEICLTCWGNIKAATRIIANDGKKITAQGVCYDLENNVAVSSEVSRRITTKKGFTYSEDMQIVTGNAAAAIAFRNSVFKIIPKAVTKKLTDEIRAELSKAVSGDKLKESIAKTLRAFRKLGVEEAEVLSYLGIKSKDGISSDMLVKLIGIGTAIKEGSTTADEVFRNSPERPVEDRKEEMRGKGAKSVEMM